MSTLRDRITEDLKAAMRAKDEKKVSTLRMLVSAMRNREISLRQGNDVELDDGQAAETIMSEIKKRRDSIAAYEQGGRPELAASEQSEIDILSAYLPEQLDAGKLEEIVRAAFAEAGAGANFGAVMGLVMPRVKGKADGGIVSALVKRIMAESR